MIANCNHYKLRPIGLPLKCWRCCDCGKEFSPEDADSMVENMVLEVTKYMCPYCRTLYDSISEAEECLEKGRPIVLDVGDIVITGRYGWLDGNPDWVVNKDVLERLLNYGRTSCPNGNDNCFDECCILLFYHVVVGHGKKVDKHLHEMKHILITDAMCGGNRQIKKSGKYLKKVNNPPQKVVEKAKEIVSNYRGEF